jgi:hypothetical protein
MYNTAFIMIGNDSNKKISQCSTWEFSGGAGFFHIKLLSHYFIHLRGCMHILYRLKGVVEC